MFGFPQNKYWLLLAFLRLLVSIIPQFGYIHPDEFFQTVEVAAGHIFGLNVTRPWEFHGTRPVRSWSQVVLSSYPPLYLLKLLTQLLPIIEITPRNVLVFERFYSVVLSFIVDFSVYKCCSQKNVNSARQRTNQKMVVLASSIVMLVYSGRTLTNSLELIIFSLLFLPHFKQSNKNIIFYSFILVLGTFIRPTFLFFAFVPFVIRFSKYKSHRQRINYAFQYTLVSSVFSVFFILFDSYSYGLCEPLKVPSYIKQRGFQSFLSSNITITPLNFVIYNTDPQNLASHGVHSRFTHSTINAFLFNSLIITTYKILISNILTGNIRSHISTISFWFIPLFLLSIFPHQEPRFLLPLIIPLTISYARHLCKNKLLTYIWFMSNLFFTLFYGFVHQAGLIRAVLGARVDAIGSSGYMAPPSSDNSDVELIFWRTYMPPQHLLLIPGDKSTFCHWYRNDSVCRHNMRINVRDLAGMSEEGFREVIKKSNASRTFVYAPGSVLGGDECEVGRGNKLVLVNNYWPHFTGEDLFFNDPNLANVTCNNMPHKLYETLCSYFSYLFGFSIPDFILKFVDSTSFKVFKLQTL